MTPMNSLDRLAPRLRPGVLPSARRARAWHDTRVVRPPPPISSTGWPEETLGVGEMSRPVGPTMPHVTPLVAHEPRSAGRYRLLGRLGAGGQGIVYLGEDSAGHRVAVKMINMGLTGTPQ